jgi:hypothetical protein
MNGFRKLQSRLQEEGWYVGWGLMCCQSCAWAEVPYEHEVGPFKGQEVDFSKVLFNHEQDCQMEDEDCDACCGEGYVGEEAEEECSVCGGKGYCYYNKDGIAPDEDDYCVFPHYSPEEQNSSSFCFDGRDNGVKNLKEILPIIEECGCSVVWDGNGNTRPTIIWEL